MSSREIHVVVVGGSWAGVTAVRELIELSYLTYPGLHITLVEQRTHYFHKTGIIRGLADKKYAEQMFIPYNRLFSHGTSVAHNHRFVCARLKHVHEHFIEVEGGSRLFYDYLIIATGTEYKSLPVTSSVTAEECYAQYQAMRDAMEAADRILFVGGGAVGIGLCGEIAEMYPKKTITLAHARERLLNEDLSDNFASSTEARLQKMGVKLVLGETVVPSEFGTELNPNWNVRPHEVVTKRGHKIECDLAIWTTGSRPQTAFMKTLSPSNDKFPLVDAVSGSISVRSTLQLADARFPYIFAVGDVNSLSISEKYATSAVNQAKQAVGNIRALIDDCYDFRIKMSAAMAANTAAKASLLPYMGTKKGVVVALGRNQEVSNTFFAKINSWARGGKRGRKYLLDKAQEMLNY
ncbi:hypothetical protein BX661DRAFT_150439 [Kickxella alabastrina]|uniref:uncharacterized protein n=1 Tax=Kickxella alabastrina TaxID=61397 RepID=UPI00221EB071|nr:uncharacterized protein BX661DRAFT_150439 [Kickxella alabastrina]KAI7834012.1 hypothetical protein BX661DRAFT_150439 [Kickxella alabastrina]